MRLCVVGNPNSVHIRRWLRYFAQRGHEVHLIGEHPKTQELPACVMFHDLTVRGNVRKLRYLGWALYIRRLVQRIAPDVLHAHQVTSAGWLAAASGYHPFLVTAWGSDLRLGARRSYLHYALARWVLRRADYVTCASGEIALLAQRLGATACRLEVLPLGVDVTCFHPAPPSEDLRRCLALRPGPVVISLRAIRPIYRPLDIAYAIPLILARVPAAQFIVCTYSCDPVLLAHFQRIVAHAGAERAVRYVADLSSDEAIADLYRLAHVAVSVPSSDAIPHSVLEAMSCGVVPVLSDLPSLREWIREGEEGLFVSVGDVAGLAEAVTRLLIDAPLRERLQANAIRLVRERADARVTKRRYEEIYETLASGQMVKR